MIILYRNLESIQYGILSWELFVKENVQLTPGEKY